MKERLDLTRFRWFHQPQRHILTEKKLILETGPHTEMAAFTDDEHNAYGMIGDQLNAFRVLTKMEYRFQEYGDECGVIVRLDEDRWLRYGIVLRDEEISEIFCVRYDGNNTDRSVREVSRGIIQLYLHVEYSKGKLSLSYSMNDYRYSVFREINMDTQDGASIGFYACSAGDSSFDATFNHTEIETIE